MSACCRNPLSWDRAAARAGRFRRQVHRRRAYDRHLLPAVVQRPRPPKPENVRAVQNRSRGARGGPASLQALPARSLLSRRGRRRGAVRGRWPRAYVRPRPGSPTRVALARAVRSEPDEARRARARARASHTGGVAQARARARGGAAASSKPSGASSTSGHAAGFESESSFHRQFLALTRMTPGAYRGLNGASVFMLQLPAGYRAQEILAYHARDPASPCERVQGRRILQGARDCANGAAVLEISLEPQAAWCRVHADAQTRPRRRSRACTRPRCACSGLTTDVAALRDARGARAAHGRAARAAARAPAAAHADAASTGCAGRSSASRSTSRSRARCAARCSTLAGEPVRRNARASERAERVAELTVDDADAAPLLAHRRPNT